MITTVIPTYKRPKLLLRAVQSAQKQNVPGHTIMVLDNASGDETAPMMRELAKNDPRIQFISHEENMGALNNFIFGYHTVKTEYFNFVSDDDLLLPNFYENALASLNQYPEAALFAASTLHLEADGTISRVSLKDRKPVEYWEKGESINQYLKGDFSAWTSIVFRKSSTDLAGGLKKIFLVDEEFVLRTLLYNSCVVSNIPGAFYISNPASMSSNENCLSFLNEREEVIASIHSFEKIDAKTKEIVTNELKFRNKRKFISVYLKLVWERKFKEAEKCLNLYRLWHPDNMLLNFIHKIAKTTFLHLVLSTLIRLRKFKMKNANSKNFTQYNSYLQFTE